MTEIGWRVLKKREAEKKNIRKESRPGVGMAKQQKLRGRGGEKGRGGWGTQWEQATSSGKRKWTPGELREPGVQEPWVEPTHSQCQFCSAFSRLRIQTKAPSMQGQQSTIFPGLSGCLESPGLVPGNWAVLPGCLCLTRPSLRFPGDHFSPASPNLIVSIKAGGTENGSPYLKWTEWLDSSLAVANRETDLLLETSFPWIQFKMH